jgi:hypothetical protein
VKVILLFFKFFILSLLFLPLHFGEGMGGEVFDIFILFFEKREEEEIKANHLSDQTVFFLFSF